MWRSTNCMLAVVISKSAYNDNDSKNVPAENPSAIFLANWALRSPPVDKINIPPKIGNQIRILRILEVILLITLQTLLMTIDPRTKIQPPKWSWRMHSDIHNRSALVSKCVKTNQPCLRYHLPLTRQLARYLPAARATVPAGHRRMQKATDKTHRNRISSAIFCRCAVISATLCQVVKALWRRKSMPGQFLPMPTRVVP